MLVTSQCHGHRVTGILVGQSNVQRYFPRNITEIELQLGHLRIECRLPSHFWNGKAEIRDARLCLWLESKIHDANHCRASTPLAMIPSGRSSFIVGPADLEDTQQKADRNRRGS